jgi:hypothetical protein
MEGDRLTSKNRKKTENTKARLKDILGLTTAAALNTLHRDVRRVLQEYEEEHKKNE